MTAQKMTEHPKAKLFEDYCSLQFKGEPVKRVGVYQLRMAFYAGLQAQSERGAAQSAKVDAALEDARQNAAPIPQDIADLLGSTDWTPETALRFYAAGKHFDVVDGHTRILDTGAIASDALKALSPTYNAMKGNEPAPAGRCQKGREVKRLTMNYRCSKCYGLLNTGMWCWNCKRQEKP